MKMFLCEILSSQTLLHTEYKFSKINSGISADIGLKHTSCKSTYVHIIVLDRNLWNKSRSYRSLQIISGMQSGQLLPNHSEQNVKHKQNSGQIMTMMITHNRRCALERVSNKLLGVVGGLNRFCARSSRPRFCCASYTVIRFAWWISNSPVHNYRKDNRVNTRMYKILIMSFRLFDLDHLDPVKQICVFEHSVVTNFNCACPVIRRGQGSRFLSEGSS